MCFNDSTLTTTPDVETNILHRKNNVIHLEWLHQQPLIYTTVKTLMFLIYNFQKIQQNIIQFYGRSTLIGRLRHAETTHQTNSEEQYIGNKAMINKEILSIHYSIERGVVTNWHHTFYNELRVACEEHPVLVTEAPLNPKANREKK